MWRARLAKHGVANRPIPAVEGTEPEPSASSDRRRERRVAVDEAASIRMLSPLDLDPVAIRVLDISRHGVRIWTPILLERGAVLQIRMRELLIMAEVRYCAPAEQGFQVGLYIEDCIERRRSPRTEVEIPATIFSLSNVPKPQQEYSAKIINRSKQGMLVAVPQEMSTGAAVRLVAEGKLYVATVVFCESAEEGFRIAIEVDQVLTL